MSGRTRHLGLRSLGLAAVSFLVVQAGCAGSKPPTEIPEEVGDTVIRHARQATSEPDLMFDDLYLDGVNVGRIPVTVELDEERDYRVVTAYDGDTFVLHTDQIGSIVTLDAIAGRLVAMDESTGVWVPLERLEGPSVP